MKYHYLLLALALAGCKSETKQLPETAIVNDTISLPSGLQYQYLTQGEGPKVEKGSLVRTILSLKVNDSVVWTSYEDKDSIFSFVAGYDPVIDGFEEMALLMREGDNVMAILPDSLAYGADGAGDAIPPNATLVYDRYQVVSVSPPRKMLKDTLLSALETGGVEAAIQTHSAIAASDLSSDYHMGYEQLYTFFRSLNKAEKYTEAEALALHFEGQATDQDMKDTFEYYRLLALEGQGRTAEAIALVEAALAREPDNQWLTNKLVELRSDSTAID